MWYLFRHLNRRYIDEGRALIGEIWGGAAPEDLITVHYRWSDKVGLEMKEIETQKYVDTVSNITNEFSIQNVNIYFISEDPKAHEEFGRAASERGWNVT